MIRAHGDAVEASLAFQGIDLRDVYRRGSGLTLRRLLVLIKALPHDAPLWGSLEAAAEEAVKAKPDELRDRQKSWEARNAARQAREEVAS